MLTQKRYADGSGPAYTYDSAGRTLTRQWARTVTTVSGNTTSTAPLTATFSYNGTTGDPVGIAYNDGLTPNVTFSDYDRLGRAGNVSDGAGARSLTYTHGVLTSEAYGGGVLANTTLSRGLDSQYRVANLTVGNYTLAYDYDSASGRLANVTWGNDSVSYAYVANSTLIASVTSKHSNTTELTATRTWDNLNRLTAMENTLTGGNRNMSYDYNNRNQRTAATNEAGEYWTYGYDSDGAAAAVGQVVSAVKKLGNSTAIPGTDLAYAYDNIGNLQTMTKNGSTWGPKLRDTGDTGANLLNQYEDWSGPRQLEILGSANSSANITITPSSGSANVTRAGKYWYGNLALSGNDAQWIALNITGVVGGNSSTELAHDYLKPEPTHLQYDADGNLIEDGKWHYWYDGENRLVRMETSDIAVAAGAPHERIIYGYDSGNRRVTKQVFHWQTVAGQSLMEHDPAVSILYLYDGWNLVAELDALNTNAVVRSYAWGLDMSGSYQGAGGVGGLVMADLKVPTGGGNTTTSRVFYGYDGNGNVITLAEANSGNIVASYDYDPFGNTITITGNLAAYNPCRFSTKCLETDGLLNGRELGLYYYGRRYLSLDLLRFLNNDPIEESGGENLSLACGNNLVNRIDSLGLLDAKQCQEILQRIRATSASLRRTMTSILRGGCAQSKVNIPDLVEQTVTALSDANAITGTGTGLAGYAGMKQLEALSSPGSRFPWLRTMGNAPEGSTIGTLGHVGKTTGYVGIGIDAVQAGDALYNKEYGDASEHIGSGGLGIVGLLIADSNPISAAVVAAASIGIGGYEQYKLKVLKEEDVEAQNSYCKTQETRVQQALYTLRILNRIEAMCDYCGR